jgi:hypothetical protein
MSWKLNEQNKWAHRLNYILLKRNFQINSICRLKVGRWIRRITQTSFWTTLCSYIQQFRANGAILWKLQATTSH